MKRTNTHTRFRPSSEQAVSVVIGALLMLSILTIAAVQYQDTVIPATEQETEFEHNQEVRSDFQQLRSNILATGSSGQLRTTSFAAGTQFEQQFIFGFLPAVHSTDPAGTISLYNTSEQATGASRQIQITGADGQGGADNFWQANQDYTYATSFLNYSINYAQYQDSPNMHYENTVFYETTERNGTENTVVQTNQNLIQGKNINIATLSGDTQTTTTQTLNLQTHPVSAPSQTVTVRSPEESSGGPLTISIPTNLSSQQWCSLNFPDSTACNGGDGEGLLDTQHITQGGYVSNINYTDRGTTQPNVLELTFQQDETFTLQLSRTHLQSQNEQSRIPQTDPSYVAWQGSDRINFRENSRQSISAQVRDRYNNPVEGVDTIATAFNANDESQCIGDFVSGQLGGIATCPNERQPGERTSGQNGEVTFFYETPSVQDDTSINLQVELAENSAYNALQPPTNLQLTSQGTYASVPKPQIRNTTDKLHTEIKPFPVQQVQQIDNQKTLRVLNATFNKSTVISGQTTQLTLTVDNTGVTTSSPLNFDATVIDQNTGNALSTNQYEITTSPPPIELQPGQQYQFKYEISIETQGEYQVQIANTDIQKEIDVVSTSSSVYEGQIQSSVERQSITKIVTSYKDEFSQPTQTAWNAAIPPVIQTTNDEYQNDAEGRIYDFGDARTPNDQSLTLESNETLNRMNLGTAFENVPQQNNYTIQLNYQIESQDDSNPVEVQLVKRDGSIIDTDTRYLLQGNEPRQTRYFSLSNKESDYIRDHKNIYVVFTAEGDHTVDLYYYQSISSNKLLNLASASTQVTDFSVEDRFGLPKTEFAQFTQFEPIYITVTKENFGRKAATRDFSVSIDNQIIANKQRTINPNSAVTETFVKYGLNQDQLSENPPQNTYPKGYYILSTENAFETQIKIGTDITGDGNYPPISAISTTIPQVNGNYIPTGTTIGNDKTQQFTIEASSRDPNGDSLTYTWVVDNENTGQIQTYSGTEITEQAFQQNGTYTVTLETSDGQETDQDSITVQINSLPPNVQITSNPSPAPIGTTIQLDASQSIDLDGEIEQYTWYANGNQLGTTTTPQYTYTVTQSGTNDISVRTTDDDGNTYSRTTTVPTFESTLVPQFTYEPTNPIVLNPLRVDASASTATNGTIESYDWYINGTLQEQGQNARLQLASEGPKNVTLQVTSSNGLTQQVGKTITVGPPFNVNINAPETTTTLGNTLQFDSLGITDPNNLIETTTWNMGDGNTYTNTNQISHEYDNPGDYIVTLTATGNGYSQTEQVGVTVNAQNPTAVANYNETIFLSETVDLYGDQSFHPTGYINYYSWTLENGQETRTETNIQNYNYTTPTINGKTIEDGTRQNPAYTPLLTVRGNRGLTDTDSVIIEVLNRGPVNKRTVTQNTTRTAETDYAGWVSTQYTFDGSESTHYETPLSSIQSQSWTITTPTGNQRTLTGETVNAQLTSELGNYTINHTVTDTFGFENTTTFTINQDARNPNASITVETEIIEENNPAQFNGQQSSHNEPIGTIEKYTWNFGDNTQNQTGVNPSHTYQQSGNYTVTLTVTDQYGQTDTTTTDITVRPPAYIIGETGTIQSLDADTNSWQTVQLQHSYNNPVVVAKVVNSNGQDPVHTRLSNVTTNNFDIQAEEWYYQDGSHTSLTVHYTVIEHGTWNFQDGTQIEAGTTWVDQQMSQQQFTQTFNQQPVLFTQVQTENDELPVVTRNQNINQDGFDVQIQNSEQTTGFHKYEQVGYIAMTPGQRTGDYGTTFEARTTANTVTDSPYQINFPSTVSQSQSIIIDQQTRDGGDTAQARYQSFTQNSINVYVEEETSADNEIGHTTEQIGYLLSPESTQFYGIGTTTQEPQQPPEKSTTQTLFFTDFDSYNERQDFDYFTNAGTSSATYTSCCTAAYTSNEQGSKIESVDINAQSYVNIQLNADITRGDPSFGDSETPDSGEALRIEYRDATGQWNEIDTVTANQVNSGDTVYLNNRNLPQSAAHQNLEIRFYQEGGSGSCCDWWHIDNVEVTGDITQASTGSQEEQFFFTDFDSYNERQDFNYYRHATTSGDYHSSCCTAALTKWDGGSRIESVNINSAEYTDITLTATIFRGGSRTEDPDTDEHLRVEYRDQNGNWDFITRVRTDDLSPGASIDISNTLPQDASHNNLQIRFYQEAGTGSDYDYWHIDDVGLTGNTQTASTGYGTTETRQEIFNEDFEGTTNVQLNQGQIGSQTYNSCCNSANLNARPDGPIVTDPLYTTNKENIELSIWVRGGDDSFSEGIDNTEDLYVEYRDQNGNWNRLDTFYGGTAARGTIYTETYTLPTDAQHNNLQIRFVDTRDSSDTTSQYDYWHIDDIIVSAVY